MQAVPYEAYPSKPYFTLPVTPFNCGCVPIKEFHRRKVYAMLLQVLRSFSFVPFILYHDIVYAISVPVKFIVYIFW